MKILNIAVLMGLFVAAGNVAAAGAESACDASRMTDQQFNDCIVVEGSGQSWSSYQQEMRELDRLVREQRHASDGIASH